MTDSATLFGFTYGASHVQTQWPDVRRNAWPEMVELLTSHVPGPKEGSCIVPAVFSGAKRTKEAATRIDMAFLDSDSGAPLAAIETALKAKGWEAVVSSTHSHMTTQTRVKLSNWDRFFAKAPSATAEDFLVQDKGYVPEIARGAQAGDTVDGFVYVDHQPCPKFRIAIPLQRPWIAAEYVTQDEANEVWKARIEALAAALGLSHDQACTDTSRLFYLPRHPGKGVVPETAVVAGQPCDIFSLATPAAPETGGLFGHHARRSGIDPAGRDYIDPITGEVTDLAEWAREFGGRWLIAKALKTRKPGVLTGHIADNRVHIDCPNAGAHTDAGRDGATFVSNGGNSATKGFVIHCRHAHCTDHDRLFFVRRMLEEQWLTTSDLGDPDFLAQQGDPRPEPPPRSSQRDDRRGEKEGPPYSPLRTVNPVQYLGKPVPARRWIVDQWLPIPAVTLNYADGGIGKTQVAQQLQTACATETPWLGLRVEPCRSYGFYCEDDEDELWRRQDAINDRAGVYFDDLADMRWASGTGEDNVLIRFEADGTPVMTERFDDLIAQAKAFGARLLIIDTAADTFGGNENDRAQVRQYIGNALARAAREIDGAVLVNAHPSRTGLSSGNIDGGSTGWNNSARSRWSLARPVDEDGKEDIASPERILTRRKANYASVGDVIRLRWDKGVMVAESSGASSFSAVSRRMECELLFLEMLDRSEKAGRPVSHSFNSGNFAPKVFSSAPDKRGFDKRDFRTAMEALLAMGKLEVIQYGTASRGTFKLVRTNQNGDENEATDA